MGTKPSSSFMCTLIKLILMINFFTFHDKIYLETHGTAMGTCMAPTYANIFMGAIKRRLHGHAKLEAFIEHADLFHPNIKFTFNISPTVTSRQLSPQTSIQNSKTPSTTCIGPDATHNTLSTAFYTVSHLD